MSGIDIKADYTSRKQFQSYHETDKRWRVIVAHRRAGKTAATINQLILDALRCRLPEPRTAYLAPLYRQAKDVAWSYLKRFTAPIPGCTVNESDLYIDLPNKGRVRLYGADNPDGLRGIYLDSCVLDEFADMRPSLLPEVIRPALSDRKGKLTVIGTPKGHNDFYHLWQDAKDDEEWFSLLLKASETGIVDREELDSASKMMGEDRYAQEYECSFEAAIQGAYFGQEMQKAEDEGRICDVDVDHKFPVHRAWDLGWSDDTVIWFFQFVHGGLHIVDYYSSHKHTLDHYAQIVKSKGYPEGEDYVPHDAEVTELQTGRTRIEQMQRLGLHPRVVVKHTIPDGIAAARETIRRSKFDAERCAEGIEALKQYRQEYDEKRPIPDLGDVEQFGR